MDRLTGNHDKKMKEKEEKKKKLDLLAGKNPSRDKYLFEGLDENTLSQA